MDYLLSSYHQLQKNKYMIVSRKPLSFLTSLSPLFLDGSQLALNESIPLNILVLLSPLIYHGLLTSNVSTLKLIKLLESSTVISISMLLLILFSLCITLLSFSIFPTAPLFGILPYLPLMLKFLRKPTLLYKYALINRTMITHLFSQLLTFRLSRHSISKLCLLYKITNNLLYFPSDIFIRKLLSSYASRHFDPLTITIPFSHSSASQNSFVPSVLSLWNSLPYHVKSSSPLITFKSKLK